ncbi:MAG: BTAD domain-containing putative transcriptional regulator [Caldilineaceae bacterium]
MTSLMLRCLGAFEVTLNEAPVTNFPTDKIRALLAYLALENAQPRETLLGLFWPEIAQASAQNNLRVALHRLRETLDKAQPGAADQLVISTRQTLQLNVAVLRLDVATFQAQLDACATHAHPTLLGCDACLARLAQAVDLYRGELLVGLAVADAPAFEEWLLLRRETLHQQALGALQTLVQAYQQRGADEQVHRYASRQLALDPSREEAHRQLMRSLARRGRRNEALAQYETCRRLLREQLDVDPDLETVALAEQIRIGQLDKETGRQGDKRQGDRRQETRDTGSREEAGRQPDPLVSLSPVSLSPVSLSAQEWGEAPEVGKVYGRQEELASVTRWLVQERCRSVALLGIGGVGKTTLAATVVRTVAPHFERVLWRSLLNAPLLDELLRDILQRLANERLPDFPASLDAQLDLLLEFLRRTRTLLVLDNLESILHPDQPGHMRSGYAGYTQLLQTIAVRSHQSGLLLTSRERPQGMARWAEDSPLVRTLAVEGLNRTAGQAMLTARGLTGPTADAASLVERYSGNPLALKLVAQTVQELFGGDIAAFLAVEAPIFDDIRLVLDQQFARLSSLEQELLLWLAVERAPITAAALRANLVQPPPMPRFLEALRALQRRSLLENVGQGFALQNVVIEYLTEQLVERICGEIAGEGETRRGGEGETRGQGDNQTEGTNSSLSPPLPLSLSSLNRHALLKAQATDAIRQSQARLLLQPVADRLLAKMGKARLATQIERLLMTLRQTAPLAPGYAGGNLLNLLLAAGLDVNGYDFSHLCVWQAYLRDAYLPGLQLVGADLRGAAFAQRIGSVHGLYFGDDQELRVIGFKEDVLGLWRARTGELIQRITMDVHTFQTAFVRSDGRLLAELTNQRSIHLVDVPADRRLHTLIGDPSPIWRVSFSPDGQYVASGHASGQICVWAVASGRLCNQWQAHRASVTALAFAPDSVQLASGAVDGALALWHAPTVTLLHSLPGHTDEVAIVGFSPDGTTLITGSHDLTVRLWETASGALHGLLQGHTSPVRQLAIASNGQWLATGGVDNFVYLWDLQTKKVQYMLADHAAPVERLTFSPDNQTLAAHDANETISVWAVASGQRLNSYRLHLAAIQDLAFSADERRALHGCVNATVYWWDVSQPTHAQVMTRLVGHRYRARTVAFSPDDALIASADFAGSLRLWYRPHRTTGSWSSRELLDAQTAINQITFSPDVQLLALSSDDGLRLWSLATGRQLHLLQGATLPTRLCAFSPDGRWLASGHPNYTICLWSLTEPAGIVLRHTLAQHTNLVSALLFSPDSHTLFSAGYDDTLRRWEVARGALQASWSTQGTVYTALAIQPDGQRIASGSSDRVIRFLDSESGAICSTWHGHTHTVEALRFSADGQLLASASQDETIRLWDVTTGACLQTLRAPGPYAGMNITGVTGISAAQKTALKALGAVEE